MTQGDSYSDVYKSAGVDITAGYEAVQRMSSHVARTKAGVRGASDDLGGFGGMFALDLSHVPNPVMVSGTDGVGTKLKLAFYLGIHDTVGVDCVAMCVNDIVCCGAKPLYFLDYIAVGKNDPRQIEEIVKGVADGCVASGCALVGGETAEMPGFYQAGEYDLAGFACGVVDKTKILDKNNVRAGDVIVGIASSGVHSNGFSLVRKVFGINENPAVLDSFVPELGGTLGEALLTPTALDVKPVLALLDKFPGAVRSLSHITGGGFFENIPRALPEGVTAVITKQSYEIPFIFKYIARTGEIAERDMYNTFNMGIGMAAVVSRDTADAVVLALRGSGLAAYCIGEVEAVGASTCGCCGL